MRSPRVRHRWRDYATPTGRRPVNEFIESLSDTDAAEVAAAMKEVVVEGLSAARHLRGDIYEVRAHGEEVSYRILFATEGNKGRILLALEAYSKKSPKTPKHVLDLAQRRLFEWRSRARYR